MKLYKIGEKSKALCPFCEGLQATTFLERTVPLESGEGTVPDILVAVCDGCEKVVGIPQQSVPRVKEVVTPKRDPIEARIPRHLLDALALVGTRLGSSSQASSIIVRFYIHRIASNKHLRSQLATLANSPEASGRATARFSAKVGESFSEDLKLLRAESGLKNARVIRGVIVQMKRDILDNRAPKVRKELEQVLRLAG